MATLHAAQGAFQAAFIEWLVQLSPNTLSTRHERFSALPADKRDEKPLRERIGDPRLFDLDLDNAIFVRNDAVGADTQIVTWDYPLIIAYPRGQRWQSAMMDDYVLIREGVKTSLTKPTGVCLVHVPDGMSVTQSEDDPWSYVQINLRVTYQVTAT